jgi:hypothetical protein
MATKAELDNLIEAALADNKLTSKEMEVLVKKAKQLGIDEDEFLIELDAKKHKAKLLNNVKTKSSRNRIILLTVSALIMIICLSIIFLIPNKKEKFETALSTYDFQKAFSLLAKFPGPEQNTGGIELSKRNFRHQQLIKAMVPFYLNNNQVQKAIYALNEYQFEFSIKPHNNIFYRNTERQTYNMEVQFFNSLWFDIAHYFANNGKIDESKNIVNMKLVPYSDDRSNPTFDPVQELKNNFQALLDGLPKYGF